MLTFDQITALIELVARHRLEGVELERSGFRLKIDGQRPAGSAANSSVVATAVSPPPAHPAPPPNAAPPVEVAPKEDAAATDGHLLTSPIVGTFYRSPSPDADPFVEVGDRVKKGQVLCIVEAMKLMNEIESDVDGVITKILPKNAQAVEFGEPLFAIRTD